jgi:hypothetical protein
MSSISRWANIQVVREMACPKCEAAPERPCRQPNGKRTSVPHMERSGAYAQKIGREEWRRRHAVGDPLSPPKNTC